MAAVNATAYSRDLQDLPSLLSAAGEGDCEIELAAFEAEVRRRLSLNPEPSDHWLRQAGELLLGIESPFAPILRGEVLVRLAWWFEDSDKALSLRLLEKALRIATQAGALSLKRRVLNTLGSVYNRCKNVAGATVSYVEALAIAEQLGDKIGRCAVIANMAVLRLNMGMIDDAIKLSRFVLELCANDGIFSSLRVQAHHCLAEAHLLLSDPCAARKHAVEALGIAPLPGNQPEQSGRVLMEATLVRALVKLGELQEAESHSRLASDYAVRADTHTARVQAHLSMALCDAARGNVDIALTRLAAIESKLTPSDVSFRDFIEVELRSNQLAGRKRYAQYYNKKYLFSLAEFQRKSAIEHVANVKRLLKREEHAESNESPRSETARPTLGGKTIELLFSEQMDALAALAEIREDATGEHCYRVGRLSRMLAVVTGYSESDAATIEQAARLHDIGKLATPDAILLKRGKLSVAEQEVMRRHPTEGCQILADLLYTVEATEIRCAIQIANGLRIAAEVAQHHHEWWDGSGYPRGIAGGMIPEAARIVALADVFDELTHARPYKRQYSKKESISQIERLSGKQFDPRLCREFVGVAEKLNEMPSQMESELSPFAAANRVIKRIVATAR